MVTCRCNARSQPFPPPRQGLSYFSFFEVSTRKHLFVEVFPGPYTSPVMACKWCSSVVAQRRPVHVCESQCTFRNVMLLATLDTMAGWGTARSLILWTVRNVAV